MHGSKKIADQAMEAKNQLSKGLKTINQVRQEFGLPKIEDQNADMHLESPKEMALIFRRSNFDTNIHPDIMHELTMYSTFQVINHTEGNAIIQEFYVPVDEHEIYDTWKRDAAALLSGYKDNAVLIGNIARRHGIRLQK